MDRLGQNLAVVMAHSLTAPDTECRCLGGLFCRAHRSPTIRSMTAATRFPPIPTAAASRRGCEIVVVSDAGPARLELSELRFTPSAPRFRAEGLLGWLSLVLNGALRIDGVAVRRTMSGRVSLSFPDRVAHDGRRHPILRPLDAHARAALETAVIAALETEFQQIA
ncbi:MAG: hypothetical protein IPN34_14680 [Planctomycetes bacterium]|nr:hypothetical protein [Planctomycetota bacterium]